MKRLFLLFFLGVSIASFGQTDTIFKANGELLPVNVTEITESSIKFIYPGESFKNSIEKSVVLKIHFKSGRKQEFAPALNVMRIKNCQDWENVQISNIESEVKGLLKIDNIGAKAKGLTIYSSIGKLQDRAYNKIKIQAAMLGGNVIYIIEQNTEEAVSGGRYGGTKLPSVTISALAYTTKKVFMNEIEEGNYSIASIHELRANKVTIGEKNIKPQSFNIKKEEIYSENNFPKIKLKISSVSKVEEYTIIYADSSEMVLSGVYTSRQGKKTYYNITLKK